jgi:hypothetical protein
MVWEMGRGNQVKFAEFLENTVVHERDGVMPSTWRVGIVEYWNNGFMDRYYPARGRSSVRMQRT